MTSWRDLESEMQRLPLDLDTADRLLGGLIPPPDAPPGYGRLASLLAAAREPHHPPLNEDQAVSMLVAAVRSSRPSTSARRSSVHRFKLAGALAVTALVCTTGLAFAGSLPGAAQDVASSVLDVAGITVPGSDDHAGTHPSVRGQSGNVSVGKSEESRTKESAKEESSAKGAEISRLATTTTLAGVEKGAAISTLASGGMSQAGKHGQTSAGDGQASGEGSSDTGGATAAEASSGHSSAGSGNAAAGQSHRP